jgi:uncharacterized protein (DUF952 family)
MMPIFHIAEPEVWAATSAIYTTADFESDGFIHCSTENQLGRVIETFYKGREDLVLLTIDPTVLQGILVYEDLDDIGERFPHVYGPIPVTAIIEAKTFSAI